MSDIAHIDVINRLAFMESGEALPITNAFDEYGDDCDLDEAVACVAGPDAKGDWLTIELSDFDEVVMQ